MPADNYPEMQAAISRIIQQFVLDDNIPSPDWRFFTTLLERVGTVLAMQNTVQRIMDDLQAGAHIYANATTQEAKMAAIDRMTRNGRSK